MTQLAIRDSAAARNGVSAPARPGRAQDVAPAVPGRRRRTTCRSRTSRTACTCRRSSPSRSARSSTGTSARAGSDARATRARGSPSRRFPNAELWHARCAAREQLIAYVRQKSELDRLQRGEQIEYVRGAATTLDAGRPDARLRASARHLQARLPARARRPSARRACSRASRRYSSSSPGKAHPRDEDGQERAARRLRPQAAVARAREAHRRARGLRPLRRARARRGLRRLGQPATPADGGERDERDEGDVQRRASSSACSTAGGPRRTTARTAGRSTPDEESDPEAADAHDAQAFYDLLEHEVIPLFYDRDEDGDPARVVRDGEGGARDLCAAVHDDADARRVRRPDLRLGLGARSDRSPLARQ